MRDERQHQTDEPLSFRDPTIVEIFSREIVNIVTLEAKVPTRDGHYSVERATISSVADLRDVVGRSRLQASRGTIITISQNYSWGRLKITEDAFNELVETADISSALRKVVSAYGVKSHEDERASYGFYGYEDSSCAKLNLSAPLDRHEQQVRDFCYNVPYIARHNRSLDDPWSLRQSAAYVQQRGGSDRLFCVILNPSARVNESGLMLEDENSRCCHLAFHIAFLQDLAGSWNEYIEYLSARLRQHDDKAQYSSVDNAETSAYAVTHSNLQDLHLLQAKIDRADHCVQSCLDIGQQCQGRMKNDGQEDHLKLTSCFKHSRAIGGYIATMTRHAAHLHRLQKRHRDIHRLLSSILIHRSSNLLQTSNNHSANTLAALLEISVQSKAQQDILTSLLGKAHADSTLLKVLSMVATVCLPASLIANVFSSNLVQSIPVATSASSTASEVGDSTGKQRLILSAQFWIYGAITVPLMAVTLLWMLFLDRRAHQKAEGVVWQYTEEGKQRSERIKSD